MLLVGRLVLLTVSKPVVICWYLSQSARLVNQSDNLPIDRWINWLINRCVGVSFSHLAGQTDNP